LAHAKKEPIFITAEAEAEYTTEEQLIDAREALSSLKRKHFGK
jgi:hypothetical protein